MRVHPLGVGCAGLATALLAPAASATPSQGQPECEGPAGSVRLFVDVEGVRSNNGRIAVTVYPDERRRFLAKGGSLYVGRVNARAGRTRVCLQLPRPGTYAFAVYHDADGDRAFDKNRLGLPAEAYGFSRNPATLFGLPNFSSVRMNVPKSNVVTRVKLTYP
jgi:uncharacterized protein (DUF2141 family)